MKTRQLYYEDPYLKEFSAVVTDVEERDGLFFTVLDQTAFFPEGGGQSGDSGTISGKRVIDTKEEADKIYHVMETRIPVGSEVKGAIDFTKRFDRMQQHTGEHMVSGIVHHLFGYNNVGFHLGEKETRLDFDGELSKEQFQQVEVLANQAVFSNLPVEVLYPSDEELALMDYRSKIEIEGQVRLISIEGIDLCACCAPHVSRTGEVGMIKILSYERFRGGCRLTMAAGLRALEDYQKKQDSVVEVSAFLSSHTDEMKEAVYRIKEKQEELRVQLNEVQARYLREKLKNVASNQKLVLVFESAMDMIAIRNFVNEAVKICDGICAVFVGDDTEGYHYIIASKTEDVRPVSKEFNQTFQGKGGGKPQMVQGSVHAKKKKIEEWFHGLF